MDISKIKQSSIPFVNQGDVPEAASQSTTEQKTPLVTGGSVAELLKNAGVALPSADLPDGIAADLVLSSHFRGDVPESEIGELFTRLAGEYGHTGQVESRQIRKAMVFAEPFIQKLGDDVTESVFLEALEKGVRVCLLAGWLQRNEGLREFPAMLRAIAMEGQLPGAGGEELDGLCIVKG